MPIRSTTVDPKQIQRLLPGVPGNALQDLLATARGAIYAAGETIIAAGRTLTPGMVVSGQVRLAVRSHDGREATLRTLGAGDMFGLITIFEKELETVAVERSVIAVETAGVLLFERASLLPLAGRHCELCVHLLRNLADSVNVLTDAAGRLAFMTVRERVARHLLAVAVDEDGRLVATATQQQLANAVGSVREVVARTLHDFRIGGALEVSRGRVVILDRDRLAESAGDVT